MLELQKSDFAKMFPIFMGVILLPFSFGIVAWVIYEIFINAAPTMDIQALVVIGILMLLGGISTIFLVLAGTVNVAIDKNHLTYKSKFKYLCKTYDMEDLKKWEVIFAKNRSTHLYFSKEHIRIPDDFYTNYDELLSFLVTHFDEKQNRT